MAILCYKEFEHAGGFVGYRVVCTIGGKYHQRYFSENHYQNGQAEILANELHTIWRNKRGTQRKNIRTYKRRMKDKHLIAYGFRALIQTSTKPYGAIDYFYPGFFVTVKENKKFFCIKRHGYQEAFEMAKEYYIHKNTQAEIFILGHEFDREIFLNEILKKLWLKGFTLSKSRLRKWLI